jgi:hypothetical protein
LLQGVSIAALWTLGELLLAWRLKFIPGERRMELMAPESLLMLSWALFVGVVATLCLLAWREVVRLPGVREVSTAAINNLRWAGFFILYGAGTFGLGYLLFFDSVRRLGLVHSALLTAGCPAVAILVVEYYRVVHDHAKNPPSFDANTPQNIREVASWVWNWPFARAIRAIPPWAALMLLGALVGVFAVARRLSVGGVGLPM